jgi:hypothetical protein
MIDGVPFADFTEASYERIVAAARESYAFEPFGTTSEDAHVLWRHDVDLSVHRALRLAEIEAEAGVRSTYFLLLHSEFYNLLERSVLDRARRIAALGHWIGLHFDPAFRDGAADPASVISAEQRLLEDICEAPVTALSLHTPGVTSIPQAEDDVIGGMVNAYGRSIAERYRYVSDSNGHWRFDPLPAMIEAAAEPRLHVLTHPEWWQSRPMSPRDRVERCITGRAMHVGRAYDELLARHGRQNRR